MKARIPSLLLVMGLLLLTIVSTGCMSTNQNQAENVDAAQGGANRSTSKTNEEQKLDELVFPKDKVIDVKVTMEADDFQDMLDNASAEEFKPASVEYNGQKIDNVAIRTKGNLSLRSVVNSDSDRYSFKIAFDEYIGSQNFYGVTKINLNNNYSDPTYMREFLAYELAEQMGLPTPKYSYVRLYVNNELKGLYLSIEQIGTSYLERNFGYTGGALYKANGGSGSELTWLGNSADLYTGLDLKNASSNEDIFIQMLNELNNGSDLEKFIDVDEVLKFIALNVVTTNMDSYLGQNKHNYYLYENQGIFNMLPWDYNMAFGGFGGSSVMIDEPTQGTLTERPMIAKLLANEEYKARYHEIIKEAIQGYLSEDSFALRIQELDALIAKDVEQDPTAFYTYDQYQAGLTSLKTTNANTVTSIQGQLDGTIASSGDGSGSGMGGRGGMGGGFGGRGQDAKQEGAANQQQNNGQAAEAATGAAQKSDTVLPKQQADTSAAQQAPAPNGNHTAPQEAGINQQGAGSGGDQPAMAEPPDNQGTPPDGATGAGTTPSGQAPVAPGNANGAGQVTGAQPASTNPNNAADQGTGGADAKANDHAAQGDGAANAQDGTAPANNGEAPPDGFGGGMEAPPDGFGGGMEVPPDGGNGMERPNGMGGGRGGAGPNGFGGTASPQGSVETALTALASAGILGLACLVIVFYKRKRL
ncbi:CotH kinase family protein [Paenibacillus sp. 1001270B_150601_E10]|uniref:CotH kinase family protein n=1 Tax=Paenibacillus sp. 1001270B_150601_E10 TaxID=2787079 RepID=UPI00189EED29|nr:CotH kinase family protein [Paenibacillus sp. 1001270B_150601_E10]